MYAVLDFFKRFVPTRFIHSYFKAHDLGLPDLEENALSAYVDQVLQKVRSELLLEAEKENCLAKEYSGQTLHVIQQELQASKTQPTTTTTESGEEPPIRVPSATQNRPREDCAVDKYVADILSLVQVQLLGDQVGGEDQPKVTADSPYTEFDEDLALEEYIDHILKVAQIQLLADKVSTADWEIENASNDSTESPEEDFTPHWYPKSNPSGREDDLLPQDVSLCFKNFYTGSPIGYRYLEEDLDINEYVDSVITEEQIKRETEMSAIRRKEGKHVMSERNVLTNSSRNMTKDKLPRSEPELEKRSQDKTRGSKCGTGHQKKTMTGSKNKNRLTEKPKAGRHKRDTGWPEVNLEGTSKRKNGTKRKVSGAERPNPAHEPQSAEPNCKKKLNAAQCVKKRDQLLGHVTNDVNSGNSLKEKYRVPCKQGSEAENSRTKTKQCASHKRDATLHHSLSAKSDNTAKKIGNLRTENRETSNKNVKRVEKDLGAAKEKCCLLEKSSGTPQLSKAPKSRKEETSLVKKRPAEPRAVGKQSSLTSQSDKIKTPKPGNITSLQEPKILVRPTRGSHAARSLVNSGDGIKGDKDAPGLTTGLPSTNVNATVEGTGSKYPKRKLSGSKREGELNKTPRKPIWERYKKPKINVGECLSDTTNGDKPEVKKVTRVRRVKTMSEPLILPTEISSGGVVKATEPSPCVDGQTGNPVADSPQDPLHHPKENPAVLLPVRPNDSVFTKMEEQPLFEIDTHCSYNTKSNCPVEDFIEGIISDSTPDVTEEGVNRLTLSKENLQLLIDLDEPEYSTTWSVQNNDYPFIVSNDWPLGSNDLLGAVSSDSGETLVNHDSPPRCIQATSDINTPILPDTLVPCRVNMKSSTGFIPEICNDLAEISNTAFMPASQSETVGRQCLTGAKLLISPGNPKVPVQDATSTSLVTSTAPRGGTTVWEVNADVDNLNSVFDSILMSNVATPSIAHAKSPDVTETNMYDDQKSKWTTPHHAEGKNESIDPNACISELMFKELSEFGMGNVASPKSDKCGNICKSKKLSMFGTDWSVNMGCTPSLDYLLHDIGPGETKLQSSTFEWSFEDLRNCDGDLNYDFGQLWKDTLAEDRRSDIKLNANSNEQIGSDKSTESLQGGNLSNADAGHIFEVKRNWAEGEKSVDDSIVSEFKSEPRRHKHLKNMLGNKKDILPSTNKSFRLRTESVRKATEEKLPSPNTMRLTAGTGKSTSGRKTGSKTDKCTADIKKTKASKSNHVQTCQNTQGNSNSLLHATLVVSGSSSANENCQHPSGGIQTVNLETPSDQEKADTEGQEVEISHSAEEPHLVKPTSENVTVDNSLLSELFSTQVPGKCLMSTMTVTEKSTPTETQVTLGHRPGSTQKRCSKHGKKTANNRQGQLFKKTGENILVALRKKQKEIRNLKAEDRHREIIHWVCDINEQLPLHSTHYSTEVHFLHQQLKSNRGNITGTFGGCATHKTLCDFSACANERFLKLYHNPTRAEGTSYRPVTRLLLEAYKQSYPQTCLHLQYCRKRFPLLRPMVCQNPFSFIHMGSETGKSIHSSPDLLKTHLPALQLVSPDKQGSATETLQDNGADPQARNQQDECPSQLTITENYLHPRHAEKFVVILKWLIEKFHETTRYMMENEAREKAGMMGSGYSNFDGYNHETGETQGWDGDEQISWYGTIRSLSDPELDGDTRERVSDIQSSCCGKAAACSMEDLDMAEDAFIPMFAHLNSEDSELLIGCKGSDMADSESRKALIGQKQGDVHSSRFELYSSIVKLIRSTRSATGLKSEKGMVTSREKQISEGTETNSAINQSDCETYTTKVERRSLETRRTKRTAKRNSLNWKRAGVLFGCLSRRMFPGRR